MKNNFRTYKLCCSAILMVVGLLLPIFTGQIPQIGSMLLPMHIPVFLCGLICGWKYGALLGLLLPVVRSFLFGMPPLYPIALAMAFEMATYGAVAGAIYNYEGYFCVKSLYRSMLLSMVIGRIVWGFAMLALLGIKGGSFTWAAFVSGAVFNAIPGVVLQLVLVPAVMLALHKTSLLPAAKYGGST